ncbi:MAG: 2,3,4,5-tetrahydropyridine-2,6-dicarboxylate N-succinyltransferase [Gemmatimonadota bacterium]|nr:2,3,4,5-tetrahydropyridine-2,6-dicarboxylate N-succinyltransferase [Gemmatimonadota bacterium]
MTPPRRALTELETLVDKLFAAPDTPQADARGAVAELLDLLESGAVRAAELGSDGEWRAVNWVKRGILLGFRAGEIVDMSLRGADPNATSLPFFDKDTFPLRALGLRDNVRVVPGGSSIRRGAYLAPGVVCMPPSYVNVGAYVGTGTMIDSHALVGSCAQVGERVHISAAAQLGGVLEPVNAAPVVIEDDVVVGGNCGVYEGTVVRKTAVLGAGVILTRSTPVFDVVRETVYRGGPAAALVIPEGAVVVPGGRRMPSGWAADMSLSVVTPIIIKYRDERTDAATALEMALR